jgi:hypothetical protein
MPHSAHFAESYQRIPVGERNDNYRAYPLVSLFYGQHLYRATLVVLSCARKFGSLVSCLRRSRAATSLKGDLP